MTSARIADRYLSTIIIEANIATDRLFFFTRQGHFSITFVFAGIKADLVDTTISIRFSLYIADLQAFYNYTSQIT